MTLAALQHCHSNALAASGGLRLPLRSRVWRGQAGEFTGGGTGSSMDFHDLRALPAIDSAIAPDLTRLPLRANAIRVFLSDLLFAADPEPILRHLGQRDGCVVIFSPFLETEARPPWSGNYEFIDPERHSYHPHRIEPATLRRYQAAYADYFALWKQHTRRHQTAFARIPAEEDFVTALFREAVPAGALEPCR